MLIVDDHRLLRESLASLLRQQPDIEVVAEADDGGVALDLARQVRPEVVLMDISMPGISGVEATKAILKAVPGTCIIGLSMHEEADQAHAILAAGARAYVPKSGPLNHLVAAIRRQALPVLPQAMVRSGCVAEDLAKNGTLS